MDKQSKEEELTLTTDVGNTAKASQIDQVQLTNKAESENVS